MTHPDWLVVERREAPLVLSFPHSGLELPEPYARRLVSPALARKDTDWWIDRLYGFARELDATFVLTRISRSVIDCNRHPSDASLYPGQVVSELCPLTTFDGEPLYPAGAAPDAGEIAQRRATYYEPYYWALGAELARLRQRWDKVVLYDCHSVRSIVPRLFGGLLPHCNIGTNSGASADPVLAAAVEAACAKSEFSHVTNGRFKGGWITRSLGQPAAGIHAIQMELACRGYMHEPLGEVALETWPTAYDEDFARPMRELLARVLEACLAFAKGGR